MPDSSPKEGPITGMLGHKGLATALVAAVGGILVALVFAVFPSVVSGPNSSSIIFFTLALLIIGFGVLIGLTAALGEQFIYKGSVTDKISTLEQGLRETTMELDRIVCFAPLVTDSSKRQLLSESLLLQPREYTELVRKLLEKPASPERIGLMGSLVGFTVTVAHDLGILAYRHRNKGFERFTIVGSKLAGDPWSVHNFQLKLMKSFVECWNEKEIFNSEDGWSIRYESVYVEHDVLAAALLVDNDSLVVLQSLNPTMLTEIFTENKYLMGFRHPPGEGKQFVFSRYRDAIDTYHKSGCEKDVVAISYNGDGLAGDGMISISSSGSLFPVPGVVPPGVSTCGPPLHSYGITRAEFAAKKREILEGLDRAIKSIQADHPTAKTVNMVADAYLKRLGKAA